MALSTIALQKITGQPYSAKKKVFPFILVTSLFFMWGLAYGLLDVLNKHFQESLHITKTRSTLLQAAYFGAYFLIAIPAGSFMNRFGYKKGIIAGLILYAAGAFMFYPSTELQNFNLFVFSLFILASGLACLETAANPYVTVLGKPETAAFRLNLSQSFNGVGSILGPLIGAALFFNNTSGLPGNLSTVKFTYLIIGSMVVIIAALFIKTKLPEIKEADSASHQPENVNSIWQHRQLINAVITQFFYVAAQVGIAAFFINYSTEAATSINNTKAAYLLSISLLLFTAGRFTGTALMKKVKPPVLLTWYAVINMCLCLFVWQGSGLWGVIALMSIFFFESIMFPTIFALGIKNMGSYTKRGSSLIIMSVAGGAVVPPAMGFLSEKSTANAYIIPFVCFAVVAWFGWNGYKEKNELTNEK